MTSQRSYHDPMSKDEAVRELKRCCGSQFDPRIVGIFVSLLEDEGEVAKPPPAEAEKPAPEGKV
jgi:HD-GYP domain-containing protein (c-di-GMP phosphodiesterase class II)